jgi:hypothetical protein
MNVAPVNARPTASCEVVKRNGVWKFKRLHLWEVSYKGGRAWPRSDEVQLFPSRFTPPFHYRLSGDR